MENGIAKKVTFDISPLPTISAVEAAEAAKAAAEAVVAGAKPIQIGEGLVSKNNPKDIAALARTIQEASISVRQAMNLVEHAASAIVRRAETNQVTLPDDRSTSAVSLPSFTRTRRPPLPGEIVSDELFDESSAATTAPEAATAAPEATTE